MIDQKSFEKNRNFYGSKGLIFFDDNILVYRRDDKTKNYPFFIDLPGGGKEEDESPFETFQRETKEEFGIEIEKEEIIYAKQYMSVTDLSKESYFFVIKTKKKTEDIIFGNEGIEYFFLTLKDYLDLNDTIPRQREKVVNYIKEINKK